jgi:putative SOS response-associated peptidase YedK
MLQPMCNRYRMTARQAEVALRFGIDPALIMPEPERLPPPELFPRRLGWVVRKENGARILDRMQWGFPPPGGSRAPVTNVRNLASPFWRSALGNPERRCIVPVTEFCEWEGEKGAKQERWFSLPASPIFAFAGIWRPTEEGRTYAFLTCEPNPLVAPIHPKAMPVVLQDEDYDVWLDGDVESACELAQPFPSQLMKVA